MTENKDDCGHGGRAGTGGGAVWYVVEDEGERYAFLGTGSNAERPDLLRVPFLTPFTRFCPSILLHHNQRTPTAQFKPNASSKLSFHNAREIMIVGAMVMQYLCKHTLQHLKVQCKENVSCRRVGANVKLGTGMLSSENVLLIMMKKLVHSFHIMHIILNIHSCQIELYKYLTNERNSAK